MGKKARKPRVLSEYVAKGPLRATSELDGDSGPSTVKPPRPMLTLILFLTETWQLLTTGLSKTDVLSEKTDLRGTRLQVRDRYGSDTNLTGKYLENDLEEAVQKVPEELQGSYAFAAIAAEEPDKIILRQKKDYAAYWVAGRGKHPGL